MIEMFDDLLESLINTLYHIEQNKEYVRENIDLIMRCIERAETIYEASLWEYFANPVYYNKFYFAGRF